MILASDVASITLSALGAFFIAVGSYVGWRNRQAFARYIKSPEGGGLLESVQSNVASIVEANYAQMNIRLNDMTAKLNECEENHQDSLRRIAEANEKLEALSTFAAYAQSGNVWFDTLHRHAHARIQPEES